MKGSKELNMHPKAHIITPNTCTNAYDWVRLNRKSEMYPKYKGNFKSLGKFGSLPSNQDAGTILRTCIISYLTKTNAEHSHFTHKNIPQVFHLICITLIEHQNTIYIFQTIGLAGPHMGSCKIKTTQKFFQAMFLLHSRFLQR